MALRDTLLLVDDQKSARTILRRIFEDSYNLLEAENGEQALLLLQQHQSCIAVILLDLSMPVMDGFQFLVAMKERGLLLNIPVLIISSLDSPEYEMKALELGATDTLSKPFDPVHVRRRVENIVELNRYKWQLQELAEKQSQTLRHSYDMIVDTLTSIIEHRSLESGQHILRIRGFTKLLLNELSSTRPEYQLTPQQIDLICRASALHDIGKISIPDSILNKPGRLTLEEFEIMKGHAATGCQMLMTLPRTGNEDYLRFAHDICHYHHERWDGGGYPDGLCGDGIPISAQAVGLADAYDALTTKRVYKPAFSPEKATCMILNGECGTFSPKLLDCFRRLGDDFAELAQTYADGSPLSSSPLAYTVPAETADESPVPSVSLPAERSEDDSSSLTQSKYLALLSYLDATVVEVDMAQDLLRVVCDPNPDFALLHSTDIFQDAIQALLELSVHPEDRSRVSLAFPALLQDILKNGLRSRTLRYRIRNHLNDEYHWYDMTLLRVDSAPHERQCFLCLWQGVEQPSTSEPAHAPDPIHLFDGALCCRNDFYFTLESGVSEELSPLCGYTPKEIAEQFNNHFYDLIYPEDRAVVHRQLASQISFGHSVELEYRICCKSGSTVWVHEKSRLYVDAEGMEHLFCFLISINHFKLSENTLRYELERSRSIYEPQPHDAAEYDPLTKLFNLNSARQQITHHLSFDSGQGCSALLLIDLDHFRTINDTYGHLFGDEVLIRISTKLQAIFRKTDIIARVNGDEFLVFIDHISDDTIVRTRCTRLFLAVHDVFRDELNQNRLSCSVGAAFVSKHGTTFQQLYRHAGIALRQAKAGGSNCYICYGAPGCTTPDKHSSPEPESSKLSAD